MSAVGVAECQRPVSMISDTCLLVDRRANYMRGTSENTKYVPSGDLVRKSDLIHAGRLLCSTLG